MIYRTHITPTITDVFTAEERRPWIRLPPSMSVMQGIVPSLPSQLLGASRDVISISKNMIPYPSSFTESCMTLNGAFSPIIRFLSQLVAPNTKPRIWMEHITLTRHQSSVFINCWLEMKSCHLFLLTAPMVGGAKSSSRIWWSKSLMYVQVDTFCLPCISRSWFCCGLRRRVCGSESMSLLGDLTNPAAARVLNCVAELLTSW